MGSPKELQRLQLSRPDTTSENVSLRSPISSRIWQAEDPTQNSGFTEDLCIRNFCVSVHGDHELMEGSFSFDTDGDGNLEIHRDFSVDSEAAYSFYEGKEDQTSLKQGDWHNKPDVTESETQSKLQTERSSKSASLSEGKVTVEKDPTVSENVLDTKGKLVNAPTVTESTLSLRANTDIFPKDHNIPEEKSSDVTLQSKDNELDQNSELVQGDHCLDDEFKSKTGADGLAGYKEVTNGELSTKSNTSELMPLNPYCDVQVKQYRSIAVSPIVPPDGASSFTFQIGTRTQKTSDGNSFDQCRDGNEANKSSLELTPASHKGGSEVQYRSVAVSPIIPPGDSSSFTFQTAHGSKTQEDPKGSATDQRTDTQCTDNLSQISTSEGVPSSIKGKMETRVEYKSVAVSPIIPPEGSSFTFHSLRTDFTNKVEDQETHNAIVLPKTYSFELTPPNHEVGTKADSRVKCVSVAVSPIIPPDGSSSFTFQSEQQSNKMSEDKESIVENEDTGAQAGTIVQYVSVAVSPIVFTGASSSFTFQADTTALSPSVQHNTEKNSKNSDSLPKTYSFELTPPEDSGTAGKVEFRSIAVSPIIPPDDFSFSFQNEKKRDSLSATGGARNKDESCSDVLPKTYSFELTPPNQEVGTQADKAECVSVAVSPIVISQGSSSFSFKAEESNIYHEQIQNKDACSISTFPNTSMQPKKEYQDVGTQVDSTIPCASIAVSPIIPLQGSCSFVFHTDGVNQVSPTCSHMLEKPSMKDAEMQVSFPVETRSIATDPMTPKGKSPRASYPEVHVKEAKSEHPEPVREVSWDEKGMTWEVYGASMEVEVLGMAIQKHLEKQIEEHGRQKVMTPQNTRGSSIRGTVEKKEAKRQPGAFRTFFHSVRRPRCCSRAGPTVE